MKPELRVYLLDKPLINPNPHKAEDEETVAVTDEEKKLAGPVGGALLGIFAPKAIEMAIGGVAAALKQAGADDTDQVEGHEIANLYRADENQVLRVNPNFGCIVGVVGTFGDHEENDKGRRYGNAYEAVLGRLSKRGLVPANADIHAVFEAEIRMTEDQTAFFLETRHFSVWDFIKFRRDPVFDDDDRAIVATVAMATATATAEVEECRLSFHQNTPKLPRRSGCGSKKASCQGQLPTESGVQSTICTSLMSKCSLQYL